MEDAMRRSTEKKVDATHRAPRAVSRARRKGDTDKSVRTVMKCGHCYKARRISSDDAPSWSSPPPLWLLENLWLLKSYSLCQKCIEKGARIEVCSEGGWAHQFQKVAGRVVCLDCGRSKREIEDWSDEGVGFMKTLGLMRSQGTIAARETEIRVLREQLEGLVAGPIRDALVMRMKRLDKDLGERVENLASLVREKGR
jgi:hypothetical protein